MGCSKIIEDGEIIIILRSVGERTEKQCKRLLEDIFLEENIVVINNVTPFSAMLEKAYNIGIKKKKKYTLMVDADILLDRDRTYEFLNQVEIIQKDHGPFFVTEPIVYDRFRLNYISAGVHLYYTELLMYAIPYANNMSLRPETTVIRAMAKKGFHSIIIPVVIGLHDYFQYYKSIVKKGMLFSKKHPDNAIMCENYSQEDMEIYYLERGMRIGKQLKTVIVDNAFFEEQVEKNDVLIEEQEELTSEEVGIALEKIKNMYVYQVYTASSSISRSEQLKNALLQYNVPKKIKFIKDRIIFNSKIE